MTGQAHFAPIPYRIRIGVTGHRSLPADVDWPASVLQGTKDITKFFTKQTNRRLQAARSAKSPPVEYEVISALAEGADRVVAKTFTDTGAALRAVLPLIESDYCATFADGASCVEFRKALAQCPHPVRIRERGLAQDSPDPAIQSQLRRDAYEDAGYYIVDHCHVLFALWDGTDSGKQGGTSAIVDYALASGRPVIRIWAGQCVILNPDRRLKLTEASRLHQYNTTQLTDADYQSRLARFRASFFGPDPRACPAPEPARQAIEEWLEPYYAVASHLAGRSQSQFFRLGIIVYALSAAAMACVALAVLLHSVIGFGAELALLILIVGAILWSRKAAPSAVWMESRLLVERIRATAFLAMCGLDAKRLEPLAFMTHAHDPDDWMVHAFDEILRRKPSVHGLPPVLLMKEHIDTRWLKVQASHHRNTETREHHARRRLEWGGGIILASTILAAGLHLSWEHMPAALAGTHWINDGLTVIAILFPAIAAALVGIQVQREHHRLSMRSASFARQLDRLSRRLKPAATANRMAQILNETDEIMLRESQDWLMLMRHVEIKTG